MTEPETPNVIDPAQGHKTGLWGEPDPQGGVMVGTYVDGERHGLWRHFAADGRLRSEGRYERGALHGPWTWYRSSGGLLQRGGFHEGAKHGVWERWDADGELLDSTVWRLGRRSRVNRPHEPGPGPRQGGP